MVATSTQPLPPTVLSSSAHAWHALVGLPLPSRRQEDWRFDDLTLLAAREPRLWSGSDPLANLRLPAGISPLDPSQSQRQWDRVLQSTGCSEHWPVQLNAAAQPAWMALQVGSGNEPLNLSCDAGAGGEVLALRLLLVLEPGAERELVCRLTAHGPSVSSVVIAAVLPEDSRLSLATVAEGHADAVLMAHLPVLQAQGSELALTSVSSGWGFSRFEPRVVQQSGGARTRLRGLQWVRQAEIADTHSMVRFDGPDGVLDQLHKTVADDAARSIFSGAVQVPRPAQRTNAAQLSRSLLLSDRARIDTKPELEIVADDVKCAHGATVSQLQSEELFYLRSRGIAEAQASRLLLQGYCQEVLRELPAAAQAWSPLAAQLQEV